MTAFKDREQLLAVFSLLIVLLALESTRLFAPFELILMTALGISQEISQGISQGPSTTDCQVFLIALVPALAGAAALLSSEILSKQNRVMVILQLIALALLCQWFLLSALKLPIAPLTTIVTVLGGALLGLLLQRQNHKQKQQQTSLMQLQMTNAELTTTRLAMVKQDEADRRILAADLHDQVLNDLKQAKAKLKDLPAGTSNDQLRDLLDQSSNQIRAVMENLTPSVLENLGLVSALEDLLSQSSKKAALKTRLDKSSVATLSFDPVEELLIYRIAQEVLNNIVKHAEARQITLKIESMGEIITISITDDGKGIQAEQQRGNSRGLRYIRQRADILGAIASWQPGKDNKGTTFKLQLPVRGQ